MDHHLEDTNVSDDQITGTLRGVSKLAKKGKPGGRKDTEEKKKLASTEANEGEGDEDSATNCEEDIEMEDEEPPAFLQKNAAKRDITDVASKSTAGSGGSGKSSM